MSERNVEYQFVSVSVDEIIGKLTEKYEEIMNVTVHPSSPEKLFLSWVAAAIVQIYNNINYAANQNLPSRAIGENLDALAQLFYMKSRPEPTPAYATIEFEISTAQLTTVIIPAGTRVTTPDGRPVFETTEDVAIAIGDTTAQVLAECLTPGTAGNGFAIGQLSECVDIFPYFKSCTNIETTGGGSDTPTDDEFYELLKTSQNAWSSAGPKGAYIYHAKSVSTDIADVVVNSPNPGEVAIYALMTDGTPAGSAVKGLIAAACNDDNVRPLTDLVTVEDPTAVGYDITLTYYTSSESQKSIAEIEADVTAAVNDFVTWQAGRIGRDINPSRLIQMVVEAGAKRCVVTDPVFTQLNDGSDNNTPDLAVIGTITLTNGGVEDE